MYLLLLMIVIDLRLVAHERIVEIEEAILQQATVLDMDGHT